MKIQRFFNLFVSMFVIGCSGTTVVLVPDPDGKVGQVSLTTDGGTTLLSQANESTEAAKADAPPSAKQVMSEKEINALFGATLANEPTPPKRYRLYFATGTANLTEDALSEIPKIAATVRERQSCDLSVIGHSDRVGDNASNKSISLQRAENVATVLKEQGLDGGCMDIRYYGENDPAVPTADNVAEERNRRVEVEIR